MSNVVGERFQVTIDRAIRERLGIEPGDLAVERIEDGRLVIEFVPQRHDRSLRGILKSPTVPAGSTDSGAEKQAAWRARSEEMDGAPCRASGRRGRSRRPRGE